MINRQVAPMLEPQVSCLLQGFRVARCRLVLLSPTLPGLQPVCRSSAVAQYCPEQHLLIFSMIGVNQGEKKEVFISRSNEVSGSLFSLVLRSITRSKL